MSLAAQTPDGTQRSVQRSNGALSPLQQFLSLFLGCVLILATAGCGGGDASNDDGEGSGGSSSDLNDQVAELISEAEALMTEANDAGAEKYMASDFEAANKVSVVGVQRRG